MINYKSAKIEDIRKKFRNKREWLLIAVDKVDKATCAPLRGRLIAHSPHQEDISRLSMTYKGHALVDYSEDPPKGVVYI